MSYTIPISTMELPVIIKYIYKICGITLTNEKKYLIESRLGPLVKKYGFSSYSELYYKSQKDESQGLTFEIVEAITTNETSFFRDQSMFDLLKYKIIPDNFERKATLVGSSATSLKMWSAACSSGQEIYSVMMVLKELLGNLELYNISTLATDISNEMVRKASVGIYNPTEVNRGLSPPHISRYFTIQGNEYKIRDELRAFATFRKINLLEPFTTVGNFDIIFCRNVAIYFNPVDRKSLFDRLASRLNPHGVLIVGSSESLISVTNCYQQMEFRGARYYVRN